MLKGTTLGSDCNQLKKVALLKTFFEYRGTSIDLATA
jgi:hypothetical protein